MMRQIKNMRQLVQEKKRLERATEEAADRIQQNWIGLKDALRPASLAGSALSSILKPASETHKAESILKSSLLYGIGQLAKNIAEKAEAKLNKLMD